MENSETQKKVIELGKLLVKELGLENSVDTLGRWMAHYISEKIEEAQKADGTTKSEAESVCATAILNLWNHRWKIQERQQPFMNFKKILEVLHKIDPESDSPFYLRIQDKQKKDTDNFWLSTALNLDTAIRGCLQFLFEKSSEDACSENTKAILKTAMTIEPSTDLLVLQKLLSHKKYEQTLNSLQTMRHSKTSSEKEYIKQQISNLDKLIQQVEIVKLKLNQELD